jgi:hypothetical protein
LADNPNVNHPYCGAIEICLVVDGADLLPEGLYTFVMGGDVSSPA